MQILIRSAFDVLRMEEGGAATHRSHPNHSLDFEVCKSADCALILRNNGRVFAELQLPSTLQTANKRPQGGGNNGDVSSSTCESGSTLQLDCAECVCGLKAGSRRKTNSSQAPFQFLRLFFKAELL